MLRTYFVVALLLGLGVGDASAQVTSTDIDPGRSIRTRADLERLLEFYEDALNSPAYSDAVKGTARRSVDYLRDRLTNGDFRMGDRIVLRVQGESQIPDTVVVQAGPRMSLPLFGDISLAGVLRSEIEPHLTEALEKFIREPVVRAQVLIRLSLQGAVGRPGFYHVPADRMLSEALMVAGGPGGTANLGKLRIQRGRTTLVEGEQAMEAIQQGLTLDQLNLQAGDAITLPPQGASWFRNITLVTGSIGGIFLVLNRLGIL